MQTTDPNSIEALKRQIAELQAQLAAQQPQATAPTSTREGADSATQSIATQGGAAVQGDIQLANGHFIGRDFVQIVAQGSDDPEEAKLVIALYLHALAVDLAGLKLGEIDTSTDQARQSPLQLADVYVPLNTTLHIAEGMSLQQAIARDQDTVHKPGDKPRMMRTVTMLEALTEHRQLTVLGRPGGGKSTFGASVLLALAQAWQGHDAELAQLGATWTHGALLPIRVVLRRFAEQLPAGDSAARAGDLWAFIGRDLDASGYGMSADTMKYVQRLARSHGALILLDGLDECGDCARRERVMAAVTELMRSAGPACRFVLTARPYAWPEGTNPAQGVYMLADLDRGQIETFIRAWYAALVKRNWRSPGEAERKMADLMQARQRADLLPLAQNPLLLTLMATLHTNRGRLPDDRADLYHESVELLMLRWNRQIGADRALLDELDVPGLKLSDLREAMEELAFQVHQRSIGRDGAADIGEGSLMRAFQPLLNGSRDKAAVVVDYIEKRAGLLLGQGEKDGERQFSFPHRTFQEFLAACHLSALEHFPAECARLARSAPTHWQLVLPLAARLAKAERGASAADELIGGRAVSEFRAGQTPAAADWTCAWLAGTQLLEIGLGAINKSERTRAIAERVTGWLVAGLPLHPDQGGAPAALRAQAGDVLARLGDPRFDAQRFHLPADAMLGFVRIAADPDFRIGTRRGDVERIANIIGRKVNENEINDAPTPTNEFYIGRYPVTVAQFRTYIETSSTVLGSARALAYADTRPMNNVSWHEARAYCNWLHEQFATSPELAKTQIAQLIRTEGWRLSLPSELEWEQAARGGLRDKLYSWDDEFDANRANTRESGINDTSVVGCFPANGHGLHDMLGNAWEWTRSPWREARYTALETKGDDWKVIHKDRLVRGGSWHGGGGSARCAGRFREAPVRRRDSLGFRVVMSSPSVT